MTSAPAVLPLLAPGPRKLLAELIAVFPSDIEQDALIRRAGLEAAVARDYLDELEAAGAVWRSGRMVSATLRLFSEGTPA